MISFLESLLNVGKIALGVLHLVLPKQLNFKLDFSSLEIAKDDWVDNQLSAHLGDILYRLSVPENSTPLYEHKSGVNKFVQL